ncbi:triose-phosphate isomerase [Thalassotalea mangrovi]|uniref:Triosephosphate isomerase n=1 Tax=Thalassotalea mangrovi TaxID=2572245 RepID=A0A4U1B2M2_9GAMM|nr:triose-phosphate isomerase [Thalassotalea mangrovi]TKB43838.1 triose-phosphate isomerase [Thalassotalea mangrovi]
MNRKTIVAANWKMNGDLSLVNAMTAALNAINIRTEQQVVICPPAPYLGALTQANQNPGVAIGGQNLSEHQSGAYTGEVSALMLKDLSVQYVIVGHSERRSMYAESSELVASKTKAALDQGLTPIVCIGESEQEREQGDTEKVLSEQLNPVLATLNSNELSGVVFAYEPVWAIGTGKTASAEMAQQTHRFIREHIAATDTQAADNVAILYGGSVNAGNYQELFAQPDIDGGLIGGASLKVEEFKKICLAE